MSYSYMFFKPNVLPLTASELSEETVRNVGDLPEIKAALARVFPNLVWSSNGWARGETEDGRWMEFAITMDGMLFLRCSFRASYVSEVQRICDTLGWIAVDQEPKVYQPCGSTQ